MFRTLGIITGTLSLVALLWEGFNIGFRPTASLILEYYERLVDVLFGWAEPFLNQSLAVLGRYIRLDIQLLPHWKHVFVLLALYVSACVKSTWTEYHGSKLVAVLVGVWGAVVALTASLASGTVPLEASASNILMAAYPIAGVAIFELGLTAIDAKYFRNEGLRFGALGAVLLLIGAFAANIPLLKHVSNIGLAILVAFVVVLGIYWTVYGAIDPQGTGETRWKKFMSAATTKLGLILLSSIAGALLFILLNAGLGILGL